MLIFDTRCDRINKKQKGVLHMQLEGKKINFLGDSITEGHGTSCVEKNYVSVFGRLSGATVRNYGIGGTRIARQKLKSECERHDLDFVQRADEMDSDADIVVVFGGTNDHGHGDAPFGSFDNMDVYTFYGAVRTLCEKLITKYPDATIVFMTPLHRDEESKITKKHGVDTATNLKDYVDIIKEVAMYYSLPVLDLYACSGLQPAVDVIREKYMPDGLHPSDAGAEIIAKRLLGFLKAL